MGFPSRYPGLTWAVSTIRASAGRCREGGLSSTDERARSRSTLTDLEPKSKVERACWRVEWAREHALQAGTLASLSEMALILRRRSLGMWLGDSDALHVVLKFSGDVEA
mgnify:CR=1 FL=1